MRTSAKVWLVAATSLVLIGCIIMTGALTMLKWDFTKLSTAKYETNEYAIDENYKNISITTDTADIVFVPSESAKSSVVCYEPKNTSHSVAVKDGALVIEVVDARKWYEHIGITFKTPKITVAIPQGEYGVLSVNGSTGGVELSKDFTFERVDISNSTGDVKNFASASGDIRIKTSTGKICVEHVSAGALDLSVSTGDIAVSNVICAGDVRIHVSTGKTNLTDIRCKNMLSDGNTGDLSLNNVIGEGAFSIERSTGDVKFDRCDAAEIFVETDTGDVTGNLLTEKIFITQTDTGSVTVPKTTSGGKCEITTDTGDIKITTG